MDSGGLAGRSDGQVLTVWRRERELFRCAPGEREVLLGRGEQAAVAAGENGFYVIWIAGRPGRVEVLLPGEQKPVALAANNGWDPVVATAPNGKGPVVAAWEEGKQGAITIRAAVLAASPR